MVLVKLCLASPARPGPSFQDGHEICGRLLDGSASVVNLAVFPVINWL